MVIKDIFVKLNRNSWGLIKRSNKKIKKKSYNCIKSLILVEDSISFKKNNIKYINNYIS
jgi:hypothetical protein